MTMALFTGQPIKNLITLVPELDLNITKTYLRVTENESSRSKI